MIEESKATPLASLDRGGLESLSPIPPPLSRGGREGLGRRGRSLLSGVLTTRGVLPYNKNLTERSRENRKNPTKAECKIWNEVLRMRQFANYKFLRQKPIDNFIVDFYCSELCLIIEIDGDSHAETIEYDAVRTTILESLGLTVIRYTNDEVLRNIEGVYDDLSQRLEKLTPLAPLDRGGLKGSPLSRGAGRGLLLIPSEKRVGEGFE